MRIFNEPPINNDILDQKSNKLAKIWSYWVTSLKTYVVNYITPNFVAFPRMTLQEMLAIPNPPDGAMLYITFDNATPVNKFYGRENGVWVLIG